MSELASMGSRQGRGPAEPAPGTAPVPGGAVLWAPGQERPRQLYGDLGADGVSLQWYEYQLQEPREWSGRCHRKRLELWLNIAGCGVLRLQDRAVDFGPLTAGICAPGDGGWLARRAAGAHRVLTVTFLAAFLRRQLGSEDGALHPLIESFVQGGPATLGVSEVHRLTVEQEQLIGQLLHPPGVQAGRRLWHQSKVLQLMADFFFNRHGEDELFCDRQKRLDRERTARVVAILRRELVEPPSLGAIAQEVGCSSCYLSRTFSRETGMTMRQYLCRLRIERAAELLRTRRYNVTEAAMEVGYSSLSHFSQTFCQIMGCCPFSFPPRQTDAPGGKVGEAVQCPASARLRAKPGSSPAAADGSDRCQMTCLGDTRRSRADQKPQ